MKTTYIDFQNEYNEKKLEEAAELINQGKLVLFPTETVYGIGADGLNEEAVKKIFIAKGRAQDNPLILHVSSIEMIKNIVKDIGKTEKILMEKFWPGPLTIIFEKSDRVPNIVTAGLNTVAVRMPSNETAKKLIEKSGTPIAAPSANISGKPSGTRVEDIIEELQGKVDCIINGGKSNIGLESTVVRVIEGRVHILRPGKITKDDFESLGLEVIVEKHILQPIEKGEKVLSPGMKYRHYAPKTKCVLVYSSEEEKLVGKINKLAQNKNVVILCKTRNKEKYSNKNILIMGDSLEEISSNMFSLLREADKFNADIIIIEGVEKTGLGLAIMNRLIRTCEYNYIEI